MTEEAEPTKVEMSAATAERLRDRGGMLYVWAPGGLPRARTTPPAGPIDFETFTGDGWAVRVDRGIAPPPRWVIKWKRFPWPRFVALYNPLDSEWRSIRVGDVVSAIADAPWP